MDVYTSEHEQVEALRRWWDKNGRLVLIGLVLMAAAVLGYRAWNDHRNGIAEAASAEYQQLLEQMGNPEKVMEQGRAIVANYPDSQYAALASMAMATAAVRQNDLDAAAAQLRYAFDHAKMAGLKPVVALRLAAVLSAQGKPKEGLALLDGVEPGGLAGAFAEARGDMHLALGDKAAAREAYRKAVAEYASLPSRLNIVNMKLDDLAEEVKG